MGRAKVNFDFLLAGVERVTPEVFEDLLRASGLSSGYLRKKLMERGVALDPLVEGVRQDSVENLERTLQALAEAYATRPGESRAKVLEGRRHLDFALRREPESELRKTALLHLRTWLENPPVYPLWVSLQKQKPPGEGPSGFA